MNLQLLSSEIVKRVHKSPDSITNLETVVANLIREELKHSRDLLHESVRATVDRDEDLKHRLDQIDYLIGYANHGPNCPKTNWRQSATCDCGLDDLLERIHK